jgi:hypothetical protein
VKAAAASAIDHVAAPPASPPVGQSATLHLAPSLIEALAERLTIHLGPIARHVVEDESRRASDAADLARRLAGRIPHPADRDAFLATAQGLLA